MARFCAVFHWCSPDVFWDLTVDEWAVLRPIVAARLEKGD
jgi:hypothetical protein